MSKQIAVMGTGYVGLVSAVGLADFGNTVVGVDINPAIVDRLNAGEPTIYEHGLLDYLQRNVESGRLSFTTEGPTAIAEADIIYLAVGTPPLESGGADLSQVRSVVQSIANNLNGFKVVVTKSTVPVGTNAWIRDELRRLTGDGQFAVVSNPEFLREGRAVQDFFHPDRIVIGYEEDTETGAWAREYMEDVYRALYLIETPFVWCNLETAELIKYASNAFLATKITFINQMAQLAEAVGADVHTIAKSMGMDGRISPKFLHPGPGYGGSCFPKDTKAVAATGDDYGVDMSLIKAVIAGNDGQKRWTVEKVERLVGDLEGRSVAVLGLAFKSETDDIRESPAITIVEALLERGAVVRVHDPKATENFRELFVDRVTYCEEPFEAMEGAEATIVATEWNQYRNLDLARAKKIMAGSVLLDARNVLDAEEARALGFTYSGIGR